LPDPKDANLAPPGGPVKPAEDPPLTALPDTTAPSAPATPAGADGLPEVPGRPGPSALRVVARGFSWTTAGQLISTVGNLALTPFVIHGLGLQRYGLFAITTTIVAFMSSLTGGFNGTANRYFPVYAGADDRVATTRLFVTLMMLVLAFGVIAGVVDWFVSPLIVDGLSMSPSLRPESLFLFRTLGILLTTGAAHSLVQAVAMARQHFGRTVRVGLLCYLLWVGGAIWVVHHHEGLRGIAIIYVLQQVVATAGLAPTAARYLTRTGFKILPWAEIRGLLGFSAKVQVTGTANLVNQQLNTFVIGSALSVRAVGIYNVSANFADQLWTLAGNVLGPVQIQMGNTLGRSGEEHLYRQFKRMQRPWVQAVSGVCAVAMPASYFGIVAWLGHSYSEATWIAAVNLASIPPLLFALLLGVYVTTMKQAGLEMRYGLFALGANVLFTVALVFLGVIGVVAASVVANVLASIYMLHLVRSKMHDDLPNFFRYVPVARALAAGAVTAGLELALRPLLPASGPLALIECGVPAGLGLGLFGVLMIGPRRALGMVVSVARTHRLPNLAAAVAAAE
jgi:O-antigen/teichoic acid export membrane protein